MAGAACMRTVRFSTGAFHFGPQPVSTASSTIVKAHRTGARTRTGGLSPLFESD
jgi:hypothetical protein